MQKRRKAQWKFGRVTNFRNLQNFVGCEFSQHCSPVLHCLFDPLFVVLYKFTLDVILVS